MPVRAGSVWRQISERADKKSVELAVGERRIGEQGGDRRLQREAYAHLRDHVLFAREVEIDLHGCSSKHHVEAARSDLRHVAGHDRVTAFWHDRGLGQRPFGAHAKREKTEAKRLGHDAASGQMTLELHPPSHARRRAARRIAQTVRPARARSRHRPSRRRGQSGFRRLRCAPSQDGRTCLRAALESLARQHKGRENDRRDRTGLSRAPYRS